MSEYYVDVNMSKEEIAELKEKLKNIKLTANYVSVSPFAYELDGSYQAITEHPTIHTYASNEAGETVCISESIDTSYYALKEKANTFEAINRLGYFEDFMKKHSIKNLDDLEAIYEQYTEWHDERIN